MKKNLYILLFILIPILGINQARVFINSGYIVMDKGVAATPTYLVIHNPAANAITRNGGGIISEREYDMIWWDIGTTAASYTVPFQYSTTSYLPLTFNISAGAGTGSGTLKFSTWHSIADNWVGTMTAAVNLGAPHDVTNMRPATSISSPSATDDSYYVVDRFWVIDANTGYTTKPNPIIQFTYINTGAASEVAGPNVLTEANLEAQRFNTTLATWGDWFGPPTDIAGAGTGTVTTTSQIGTANFFRSWTLSDKNAPLPIQLTSFTAECDNNYSLLKWSSASEINNKEYTLSRSADGAYYTTVASIKGAGTTSIAHDYSFTDITPLPGTSYYRLTQTDYDENTTVLNVIGYKECTNGTNSINAYTGDGAINLNITSDIDDSYTVTVLNVLGQVILTENHSISIGNNTIKLYPNVSDGIYILNVKGEKTNYNKKLFIGR
ncbi:MAG TPA: T9SS type A sorting domain-containing protein [Bacteroidia bacterium]|jgi:hypothetical protein|nr:T9SS type A sorting domain-containing protein [Bacteroidia bacterium]